MRACGTGKLGVRLLGCSCCAPGLLQVPAMPLVMDSKIMSPPLIESGMILAESVGSAATSEDGPFLPEGGMALPEGEGISPEGGVPLLESRILSF